MAWLTLFVTDKEMLRRMGLTEAQWGRAGRDYERRGFPRPDPLTGLRYWPAVHAFFDRQFNVSKVYEPGGPAYDLPENLEALKRPRGGAKRKVPGVAKKAPPSA